MFIHMDGKLLGKNIHPGFEPLKLTNPLVCLNFISCGAPMIAQRKTRLLISTGSLVLMTRHVRGTNSASLKDSWLTLGVTNWSGSWICHVPMVKSFLLPKRMNKWDGRWTPDLTDNLRPSTKITKQKNKNRLEALRAEFFFSFLYRLGHLIGF